MRCRIAISRNLAMVAGSSTYCAMVLRPLACATLWIAVTFAKSTGLRSMLSTRLPSIVRKSNLNRLRRSNDTRSRLKLLKAD